MKNGWQPGKILSVSVVRMIIDICFLMILEMRLYTVFVLFFDHMKGNTVVGKLMETSYRAMRARSNTRMQC